MDIRPINLPFNNNEENIFFPESMSCHSTMYIFTIFSLSTVNNSYEYPLSKRTDDQIL